MAGIAPLLTGYVKGRFGAITIDTSDDVDTDPDVPSLTGTVTLTPSPLWIAVVTADPVPETFLPTPVVISLDVDGYLALNGDRYIGVLATNTTAANPTNFTYLVTYNLQYGGERLKKAPHSIQVPAGLPAAAVDLTVIGPVASSAGNAIVVGPAGPIGPAGPGNDNASVAGYVSGAGATRNAVDARAAALIAAQSTTDDGKYGQLPAVVENTQFVTVRGDDASDGTTIKSAKLTLAAAITALGGNPGRIQLGAGNITTAATHTLPTGTEIRGAGRGISTITYTGTAALFQGVSATRTYNQAIRDVSILGPGKVTTSITFDMVDVSNATIDGVTINTFGTGFAHRSTILGGAVYNRFTNSVINSVGVGVDFGASGSNGSSWWGVKFGSCTIAANILDSNQNNFTACQFEGNTTGVKIDSTAAGSSDHNALIACRFEGNTTAWNIVGTNVRDTAIISPAIFGTYTVADAGTRTITMGGGAAWAAKSAVNSATGCWKFERYANATIDLPAMLLRDSASGSGTPTTLQVETERSTGFFFRGKRGGATYAEVTATGQARFAGGIGVGNSAAATTPGSVVKKMEVFDAAGASLGFVAIYNAIT